jgi:hypothetical protein
MKSICAVLSLAVVASLAVSATAGTQDFTLVNKTGVPINNLYISETGNDDWEEDVLGADVLDDGASIEIQFSGKKACKWDLMVKDDEGGSVYWRKIDLCQVSKVILKCGKSECTAEFE